MWEETTIFSQLGWLSRKKEPIFPSWLDAMNYAILYGLPPPYRHGKEVCQGCYYRFCSPSWRG